MLRSVLLSLLLTISFQSFAQIDTATFTRIGNELKNFRLDTSAVPEDRTTALIRELRGLHGVFNIEGAISFKMGEDLSKGELTKESMEKMKAFFTTGRGKQLLDNALIHIYREQFTRKELKQLVRFYKSDAGQKMSARFAVIMLESFAAAQLVHDIYK